MELLEKELGEWRGRGFPVVEEKSNHDDGELQVVIGVADHIAQHERLDFAGGKVGEWKGGGNSGFSIFL